MTSFWHNKCYLYCISDYIAWKGRFCAFEYATFENMMKFVFAQALGEIPTIPDPWDTAIDVDALGKMTHSIY